MTTGKEFWGGLAITGLLGLTMGGCLSDISSTVCPTRDSDMVRERGYVIVQPIRMTEISSTDMALDLGTFLDGKTMLEYLTKAKQENSSSLRQHSATVALAVKTGVDSEADDRSASLDSGLSGMGTNNTQVSYYDLIDAAANSQLLAKSLVRRYDNASLPADSAIYCIPIDVTVFPGTITERNYRADILLRFNSPKSVKNFKIFAVAPYEYAKVASRTQAKLRELFLTFAAKGTIHNVDIEGKLDEVIRSFATLQNTLSRPEFTITMIDGNTILFTYWGYSDIDGVSHLTKGESFRCELFAYCSRPNEDKNPQFTYDYMWQYTPTKNFCWWHPLTWGRKHPRELGETAWPDSNLEKNGKANWEAKNCMDSEVQNYRFAVVSQSLPMVSKKVVENTMPTLAEKVYRVGDLLVITGTGLNQGELSLDGKNLTVLFGTSDTIVAKTENGDLAHGVLALTEKKAADKPTVKTLAVKLVQITKPDTSVQTDTSMEHWEIIRTVPGKKAEQIRVDATPSASTENSGNSSPLGVTVNGTLGRGNTK